jgi:hypothetical protein
MLKLALVIFIVAAAGGLYLATRIFKGERPPIIIALVHGAVAAAGLVLVLLAALQGENSLLVRAALTVLIVAALGGFYLFSFHVRGLPHPRGVIVLHALLAVTGVGLLLIAVAG